MGVAIPLILVLALAGVGLLGAVPGLGWVFGVIVPYAAFALFIVGFVWRVLQWGRSPVPFRIPTTCGQQKSLPWVRQNKLDNPSSSAGVLGRMALEIFFFRSLFRNTSMELRSGPKLAYGSSKWLWAAGLAFHWSLLAVVLRHMRFFTDPTPRVILLLQRMDEFFQVGLPALCLSGAVLLAALTFLVVRRLWSSQLRYISLLPDYFPLFLLIGIGTTGFIMRYTPVRADIASVKELAMGLARLHPTVPADLGAVFFAHLFLVSALFAIFPFSKLMHMGGVFLSPTRNLANNSRAARHINPWNPPVKVHTYAEWEDEFRDKLKAAGLPLEKQE